MMRVLSLLTLLCTAGGVQVSPIEKTIELLSGLQQKIIREGEDAQKVFAEFSEWCEDRAKNSHFEIKTAKAEVEGLKATIGKAVAEIGAQDAQIEQLSASIATDEADLKAASEIRQKEHADFSAEEQDLSETVDTLHRAVGIIERQQKGGASLVQLQKVGGLVGALKALVDATAISTEDASRLTAFVQNQQESADEADELGAPDPTAYENHSSGIVDILNDLLAKAEDQLGKSRKAETNSRHNFELLQQELQDAIKFANKELDQAKKAKSAAAELKAASEGDLAETEKGLAEDTATLQNLHHDCQTKSSDFELSTRSRGEELKALAAAKKIIIESTGGASAQTYSLAQTGASFLQLASGSRIATSADLANYEAVRFVQKLSRRLKSAALAQLAKRMVVAARFSAAAGEDPFAKVKTLISAMVGRLEKEAKEDASQKAYCDKELAETKQKKDDLNDGIDRLNAKINTMTAQSKTLKEEVAALQKDLGDLAKSQAEMDKVRAEEHAAYESNKPEMEQGLDGIKMAIKVLRDYYSAENKGHAAAEGAGGSIIGMLEVVESDFSQGLSEMVSEEQSAKAEYEKTTQENHIAKVTKEQDVKYKTKEATSLDKAAAEASSDREGLQTELAAVLEYDVQIKAMCIAKAEPYAERKRRRDAEVAGLKQALQILEGEAVFLQQKNKLTFRAGAH